LYSSSKAILKEAGYTNAGTCEFLVGVDGTISFLEVNTRLQVEHPVTEEVAGIDLVREQFRIAEGGVIDYADPVLRGHSIEFRINGEDPGRGFLPAPGVLSTWKPPSGPGIRVDSGFRAGDVIGGNFDSLLAKLIVTGRDRAEALERSRRALDEFEVDGIATALTFHRAVVRDPAFAPESPDEAFTVHTRWIETEFDNQIPAYSGTVARDEGDHERETIVLEVNGKRVAVTMPAGLGAGTAGAGIAGAGIAGAGTAAPAKGAGPAKRSAKKAAGAASGDSLTAPMQGTIVKVEVSEGDVVAVGDLIVVLEAMKMEQPLTAHKAGTVTGLTAEKGATVSSGTVLCEIKG
jgi:acetyl-CoA/propionyl-CoA carboxylase biotin carboxyl carrier protein